MKCNNHKKDSLDFFYQELVGDFWLVWLVCGFFVGNLAGLWMICGWFVGGLTGFCVALLVCGWFGKFVGDLDGLWVVSSFTANAV